MTVLEALSKAYGFVRIDSVFLGRYIYGSTMTTMTPVLISSTGRKACMGVTEHAGEEHHSFHDLPADDVKPYGPDIAHRPGEAFVGFFGRGYDQIFLLANGTQPSKVRKPRAKRTAPSPSTSIATGRGGENHEVTN